MLRMPTRQNDPLLRIARPISFVLPDSEARGKAVPLGAQAGTINLGPGVHAALIRLPHVAVSVGQLSKLGSASPIATPVSAWTTI